MLTNELKTTSSFSPRYSVIPKYYTCFWHKATKQQTSWWEITESLFTKQYLLGVLILNTAPVFCLLRELVWKLISTSLTAQPHPWGTLLVWNVINKSIIELFITFGFDLIVCYSCFFFLIKNTYLPKVLSILK